MKDTPQVVFEIFSIKTKWLPQSKDIRTKVNWQLRTVCVSVDGCGKQPYRTITAVPAATPYSGTGSGQHAASAQGRLTQFGKLSLFSLPLSCFFRTDVRKSIKQSQSQSVCLQWSHKLYNNLNLNPEVVFWTPWQQLDVATLNWLSFINQLQIFTILWVWRPTSGNCIYSTKCR